MKLAIADAKRYLESAQLPAADRERFQQALTALNAGQPVAPQEQKWLEAQLARARSQWDSESPASGWARDVSAQVRADDAGGQQVRGFTLGWGEGEALGAKATVAGALQSLRDDLNVNVIDGSPLTVTQSEVRSAHATLMGLPAALLGEVLSSLDDAMLNRLLARLGEQPFDLTAGRPSPLAELATKLSAQLDPAVGAQLIARLDDTGKRRLLEGVLQLPTAAHVTALRNVLGEPGFEALARGGKTDTLIGGGLIAGKLWRENVTVDFGAKYQAASEGALPVPEGARDTVFFTGPGLFGDQLPGYLEPNARALTQWGVPSANVAKLEYNTADLPAANADRIYEQINAAHQQGKRVVVMGHSKFGRDMLEAFARHPELRGMVSGAVMMQPALSANIARDLARPELRGVLDPVLQLVGGNRGAFNGLAERIEELPPWPSDVPTVVYATSTESPRALLHAGSHPYYQHFYNAASDGAVAFQDQATLDGAYLVSIPGRADHAQPGLTFTDLCEHFARQLDTGAPDSVVRGMFENLRRMLPEPRLLDAIVRLWTAAHDDPAERARCATMLRALGPPADGLAHVANNHAGYPLIDNGPMTQALVSQLFERMRVQA